MLLLREFCSFSSGMAGDLAESAVKRACKIKDSGHTIPGIGGVFDLVDSPMMTAGIFLFLIMIQTLFGLAFFNLGGIIYNPLTYYNGEYK